jgi:uncharacterized Zn-finger protein
VRFYLNSVPTNICSGGSPQFTTQNVGNDSLDSDANTATGLAPPVFLAGGETNRTVDAGIRCPTAGPASLGDRVWRDINGNGIQDCSDTNGNGIIGDPGDSGSECQNAGIPNVRVALVDCTNPDRVIEETFTDPSGFYLFDNLSSGTYCVRFYLNTVPPEICGFGSPQFTTPNAGNDMVDSDADPSTGISQPVVLAGGETNRTVDAGIRCAAAGPAFLGDRVWLDLNGNGIQDCSDTNGNGIIGDAGDSGSECRNAGIPNVRVALVDCTNPDRVLEETRTDDSGFYLFDWLDPGTYCVRFYLNSVPTNICSGGSPQFTTQNVGNDSLDSDANTATGLVSPVVLAGGEFNRTVDAGIVCRDCAITIDKKCQVILPPAGPFECSKAKPINSLTMIWGGTQNIRIRAWKGNVGSTLLADIDNIVPRQEITVSGYAGSPNDVYWEIFSAGSSNKIGESTFHVSCSDENMNGPEDCGKLQGDGKGKSGFINSWIFDGMAGNGIRLDCTPSGQTPSDQCRFEALPSPNCETLGKPKSLTFRYTGSDCSASRNTQGSKADCSGDPGSEPISIRILKDPARIQVSPISGINIGDLVTVSARDKDMGAEIQLNVGSQFLQIHTSCSAPLAVGDVFGSLELLQFNGQGSGAEVTYSYKVSNISNTDFDLVRVFDDKLGELLDDVVRLRSGESIDFEKTTFINQTTTNVATAEANISATDVPCGKATDQVTVTVVQSSPNVSIQVDGFEDGGAARFINPALKP